MKKQLLSLGFVVAMALHGFAQSKVVLPASVYEDMKAHGQLKPDVQYTPIDDNIHPTRPLNNIAHDPNVHTPMKKNVVHNTHNQRSAGANCSCIATIDTSFQVAPICQGGCDPPEYRTDDGSTAAMAIPFNFCLYGTTYTSLYINENGNITFDQPYTTFSPVGFPSSSYVMVAPFWADVMTTNPASGLVYYKITPHYMIVQWDSVGYYDDHADLRNTFQVIITDGTDPILPAGSNIAFCYGSMEWTTGDVSPPGNVGGLGGDPATVGVNKGNDTAYYTLGRFNLAGNSYNGPYASGPYNGVAWLSNQSFYFNSCASTNIPPIASGINNCDTIKVCGFGDTLVLSSFFLSPESGQNTTVTVNFNGLSGASVLTNVPGNTANVAIQIIASPANAGNHLITFTAVDNGSPVGTTVINEDIFIDTTGIGAAFHPIITGNLNFCQGGSTTLSVSPTTYTGYSWNTGSNATSISVTTPGTYYVTSDYNGCYKTNIVNVTEHPTPTPLIVGPLNACNGPVTLSSDSLIYTTYNWSPSGGSSSSATVGIGTYQLTVIDQYGCTATSASVTVSGPPLPVITSTLPCNTAPSIVQTTTPGAYTSFLWSDGSTVDTAHVHIGQSPITVTVHDTNGCVIISAPYTPVAFTYALSVTGLQPFCTGNSIILTASTNNATNNPTYTWTPSGTHDTIHVGSAGSYTVTLHYGNGCTADSTIVVPAPYPLPAPVITGLDFTCNGNNTTLTGTAPGSTNPQYVWNGTANPDSTNTASVPAGTYFVTVTDNHGCVGISQPVIITNINPAVTISGNAPFCQGSNTTLTANPSPTSNVTYSWSPNNQTTPTITVSSGGVYHVTVTYGNGCNATASATATLYPEPVAGFTDNPPITNSPVTNTQFTSTSTINSGTIQSYFWDFGDGNTSNVQNPIYSYSYTGTYSVLLIVTSNDGCVDSIREDYLIQDIVQVPNVITPNDPGIYGVNNILYFKNLEYYRSPTISIFNRWGNKVYESSNYQNDWNGGKEKDGVYYYILNAPIFKEPIKGFFEIIR